VADVLKKESALRTMPLHNIKKIRVPSKTFLTGEYAVLNGFNALIMTHEPFFKCSLSGENINDLKSISFHMGSPAGKLEIELSGLQCKWNFEDPHGGAGGFGGSTAEFISVYKTLKPDGDLFDLRERYFSFFKEPLRAPSGADLVAQYNDELGCMIYSKEPFKTEFQKWPFENIEILILKTNTKLVTHEHLESLKNLDFSKLGKCSDAVIEAFVNEDESGFIDSLDKFSLIQSEIGLLNLDSFETAEVISQIDEVFTARGCGAMGADVIAVFVKKGSIDYVWKQIMGLNRELARVAPR